MLNVEKKTGVALSVTNMIMQRWPKAKVDMISVHPEEEGKELELVAFQIDVDMSAYNVELSKEELVLKSLGRILDEAVEFAELNAQDARDVFITVEFDAEVERQEQE